MIPAFDIFKVDKDGHLIWCAAATTFEEANSSARALARADKRDYVILNQKTGKQLIIRSTLSDGGIPSESHLL